MRPARPITSARAIAALVKDWDPPASYSVDDGKLLWTDERPPPSPEAIADKLASLQSVTTEPVPELTPEEKFVAATGLSIEDLKALVKE